MAGARASVRPELLSAWRGPSLLVVNTRGECGSDQPLTGFYLRETRILSTLQLTINQTAPWLCESASTDPRSLIFNFVYPEVTSFGGGGTGQAGADASRDSHGVPERACDLRVTCSARIGRFTVLLSITNRARETVTLDVRWHIGADFADIQEAQSGHRQQNAAVDVESLPGVVRFAYRHPKVSCQTEIGHDGDWIFADGELRTSVALGSQETFERALDITGFSSGGEAMDAAQAEAVAGEWVHRFTHIEVPGNRQLEQVLAANIEDVASFPLFDGPRDEWLACQAGMPSYPAFFGRDALTAGWQIGCVDCGESLDAALTKLGRLQSDRFDEWHDEEPGRLPYQVRRGPLAILDINPYAAYYADYASPLMFVISFANLWAWTGDRERLARHWDVARRILEWARQHGDLDGDGYLEYRTRSQAGTKNQGWKDSGDAIVYDDGRVVPSPIATCELQGYWYIAQELMAILSAVMNAPRDALAFRRAASDLKQRFNRDWWVERERFFAMALDPDKRQVAAVSSNVGHCIACGIVDDDRLPQVVDRLFAPDLFSGWGIRTLSANHAFYNPLSYHRGTVWPVEQATIVFGLRRFGFVERALELARAQFDLALLYPGCRSPECVGGYSRSDYPTPGAYPRANPIQMWNASAFPLLVQSMLGLLPIGAANTLILDPALPDWCPDLVIRNIRVAGARVTIRAWREGEKTKWERLDGDGTLHLVQQPPVESLTATWWDRVTGMLHTLTR